MDLLIQAATAEGWASALPPNFAERSNASRLLRNCAIQNE
jgi:hypothetical protein